MMTQLTSNDNIDPYLERDKVLVSLGYKDYENYRSRAKWKKIRERVLARDNQTCRRCNGRACVVHHRSYTLEVLDGMDDAQLASLCDGCHNVVEIDDNGSRRSFSEKDLILMTKCWSNIYPIVKVDLRLKFEKHPAGWDRMNWWQQTGYSAEYQYERVRRKWPETGAPHIKRYLTILENIKSSSENSNWREMYNDNFTSST
jgi:hypothetical protein